MKIEYRVVDGESISQGEMLEIDHYDFVDDGNTQIIWVRRWRGEDTFIGTVQIDWNEVKK